MLDICLGDSLHHQLKEQGYKFIADVNVSWAEEMSLSIDRLYVSGYATKTEYKKIRKRFLEDLKSLSQKLRNKKLCHDSILSA